MRKIEFKSLKLHRATDIIESRISGMIINRKIKPNEKLPTERELSDQFNVSIATIREALRGLEVAGMIEKKRGRGGGIYVTEIDNESVVKTLHNFFKRQDFSSQHLAEVRLMIEPTIIKNVAQQLTSDELTNLENNVTFCTRKLRKSSKTIPLIDYHAIGGKNIEFHKLIVQATNNPVLVLTMDYILNFVADFKKSLYIPDIDFCTKSVSDHRSILAALRKGNSAEAEAKMLSHLKYLEKYQMDESL